MRRPVLLDPQPDPTGWTARLVRGRGNALEEQGLAEIEEFFGRAAAEGAPPVLLTSAGPSFCTGLDLDLAWGLDRAGMRRWMIAFHRALARCFAYPGPVVAALGGHALAGGALLALACDRRVMAIGTGRFGVHGVHLGISYPDVAIAIVRHHLSRRAVEELLYRGARLTDQEALRAGLIDRVVDGGQLLEEARRVRDGLVAKGGASFAAHKRSLRDRVVGELGTVDPAGLERWLDRWFHPETRRRVAAARSRLARETTHPDHEAH